jgi:SAM-dependent methyltransferase
MSHLSQMEPLRRFTDRANLYARFRPTYPVDAVDFVLAHCQLRARALMVDVGCGTGISSRLFAERGLEVIGIEPNAAMRGRAEAESAGAVSPSYGEGSAEATGLSAGSVDAVLAAQAFHWFRPNEALAEFQRILKAGGWVILIWNERDESDAFTASFGDAIRSAPGAAEVEKARVGTGDALLTASLFVDAERRDFRHFQVLDEEGVLGRAFSTSYVPHEGVEAEKLAAALRAVFARHQSNGQVVLRYVCSVYVGRKSCD